MSRWIVTIEAWPHSLPGKTRDEAQELAGERRAEYEVEAQEFRDVVALAHAIQKGIKSNPAVWEAAIVGVRKVS